MCRVLLTILVGLPMLMPPGMCFCQFVPYGRASAGDNSLPFPTDHHVGAGKASGRSCGCCSSRCGSDPAERDPGKPGDQPTIPAQDSDHVPLPGRHAPGCPFAFTAATERVALPNTPSPVQMLLVPIVNFVGFLTIRVKPTIPSVRVSNCIHSPPLFVVHCSLLI